MDIDASEGMEGIEGIVVLVAAGERSFDQRGGT